MGEQNKHPNWFQEFSNICTPPPNISSDSEALSWWYKSLNTAAVSFSKCRTPQDRMAWFNELARLCAGYVKIPRCALDTQDWLQLFELEPRLKDHNNLIGHTFRTPIEEWNEQFSFDVSKRRLLQAASGDGLLKRLSDGQWSSYLCHTQKSAVRAAVTAPDGSVLLVSMPTGSGKSLVFQLAVLRARELAKDCRPVGVVVVPTVALALSHVQMAKRFPGLERSSALLGSMSQEDRAEIFYAFGSGDIPLLFLSPEIAMRDECFELLMKVSKGRLSRHNPVGRLTHFVIDEAHIVESWGRTFRPDFQRLPGFIAQLKAHNPTLHTLLLSATISKRARDLLHNQYGVSEAPFLEMSAKLPRHEFDIFIDRADSREDQIKMFLEALIHLPRPLVVYTTEIQMAEDVHSRIEKAGFRCSSVMTGNTSADERERIVDKWSRGAIDIVVGTAAFGMGIDKSNVRAVVHLCIPEDAARYYQEIGRGGRDGHMALAWCVWTDEDIVRARSLVSGQLLGEEKATLRWTAIVADVKSRSAIDVSNRNVIIDVDLKSAHAGLGKYTGRKNINWNRSLLNQLQRANAIRVLGVSEKYDCWKVEILDSGLLGDNPKTILNKYLNHRHDEVSATIADTNHFVDLIENGEGPDSYFCFLAEVFEAVESHAPNPESCGRCHWCRMNDYLDPPVVQQAGGMSSCWGSECGTCVYIVHPEDEACVFTEKLFALLVNCGVHQFVVPSNKLEWSISTLASHSRSHGLVLGHEQVFDDVNILAHLPTALVLNTLHQPTEFLEELVSFVCGQIKHSILIVSSPRLRFLGRPIADVLTKVGSFEESQLKHLTI